MKRYANGMVAPKWNVGDVSSTNKEILGYDVTQKPWKRYIIKCLVCGQVKNTSCTTFETRCHKCVTSNRDNKITLEEEQWRRLRNAARWRGIGFSLSKERASQLFHEPCYYCGSAPSQRLKHSRRKDNVLIYNGIDRKNNKDYTDDECVACCWECNRTKGPRTVVEWKQHIVKLSERVDRW